MYNKIARDKRHKNVIEIDSGFSEIRTFSNWSMTFKKLQKDETFTIPGYRDLETDHFFNNSKLPRGKSTRHSLETNF